MDPSEFLFSLPTLCDPAPAVDASPPPGDARSLHEDDWRQIEFAAPSNLDHIRRELATLAAFKQQYRQGPGWTEVYVRAEHPEPLAHMRIQSTKLPAFPLYALTLGGGTVRGGFALSEGGDWFIYGQRTHEGHLIHLAVSPGRSAPSEQLARALSQFAQAAGVLLVDWYAVSLVETSSPEAIMAWGQRYA